MGLSVVPFLSAIVVGHKATFNICPTKATSTTATSGGTIGLLISGGDLFNAYEGQQNTAALTDNVSYTFTDSKGVSQTVHFLDSCNAHPSGVTAGYTWHYHGVPGCVTGQVDTTTDPSHIIDVALDGFPVYGGRDINGDIIGTSRLDACNGITSATPEFPTGPYHYVLPIGITNGRSSLGCYTGTVSATILHAAKSWPAKCPE